MVLKSYSVILFLVIFNTFAGSQESMPTKPVNEDTCSTKLSSCEIDGKVEILGRPGEIGPIGLKGDKGEKGETGPKGKDGLKGNEGRRGPQGETGKSGKDGAACLDGLKGIPGAKGATGDLGEKGDKGDQGLQGPKGETGRQGRAGGVCGCLDNSPPSSTGKDITWATKENPGQVTCRNAPPHTKQTEISYLKDGFPVKCDFETKNTCITSTKHKAFSFKQSQPFWLSKETENFTLSNIYDLNSNQLFWIQKQSFTAELTIRYHCFNSNPVGSNPVILLTWNDVKIGPESTSTTSFHYDIENDYCSSALENEWSYTDLVLVSPIAQRLPVIDFYISDVRSKDQALRIEIKSLCFA